MENKLPASKVSGFLNQLFDREAHRRVVRCYHRARAYSNQNVDRDLVTQEPAQDPQVGRAAQPARAENQSDSNLTGAHGTQIYAKFQGC